MKALSVVWKDILIFLKSRGQLFTLFLLPLIFILAFAFGYSALTSDVELIPLPLINLDPDGEMARELIDSLNRDRGLEVKLYAQDEAQAALEAEEIERLIVIPAGFTEDIAAGRQVTLHMTNSPTANTSNTDTIQQIVDGVAKDLSLQTQLIAGFQQMGSMLQAAPEDVQVFTTERIVAQAQSQFERARTQPLVSVEQALPATLLRGERSLNPLEIYVPRFTVLFVFLTAGTTALAIYTEKKIGTFRRLMSAPIAKSELLAGKTIPNLIIVLLQIVVIFGVGALLLPLLGLDRISLGDNLLALSLVSLLVALCSTSLGLLIAALARTEAQISAIAQVALWVMAALGGAFIPTWIMGEFLGSIGKVVPHYWAIQAYTGIMVRGQSLADIGIDLAVLAGFTVLFFAVGLWRFRFE
ncbi:MAG: ABC transporter permease [Anaerolineae bacterium]|jgi:ABC-2 type transport system permease protein